MPLEHAPQRLSRRRAPRAGHADAPMEIVMPKTTNALSSRSRRTMRDWIDADADGLAWIVLATGIVILLAYFASAPIPAP